VGAVEVDGEHPEDQEKGQGAGDDAVDRSRLQVVEQVHPCQEVVRRQSEDDEQREEGEDDRVLAGDLERAGERRPGTETLNDVHAADAPPKAARITVSSSAVAPSSSATMRPERSTRMRC